MSGNRNTVSPFLLASPALYQLPSSMLRPPSTHPSIQSRQASFHTSISFITRLRHKHKSRTHGDCSVIVIRLPQASGPSALPPTIAAPLGLSARHLAQPCHAAWSLLIDPWAFINLRVGAYRPTRWSVMHVDHCPALSAYRTTSAHQGSTYARYGTLALGSGLVYCIIHPELRINTESDSARGSSGPHWSTGPATITQVELKGNRCHFRNESGIHAREARV
ncbi:hypothetical protein CF326_g1768 [Tilletia indica]|nr:hypothetical protein CF326_g1768 [Tilletia indica]